MKRFLVAALTVLVFGLASGSAQGAVLTPNITGEDNGTSDCSLREAVDAAVANTDGGGCDEETTGPYGNAITDEIVLPSGPYNITKATTNEDLDFNGDIDIGGGGPIVIRSSVPGTRRDVSMGPLADRVIELVAVNGTPDVTLRDINLGSAGSLPGEPGGVIQANANGSSLSLENVRIVKNDDIDATNGGLISVSGADNEFSMSNSFLQGGNASSQGGALFLSGLESTPTISRSVISFNTATAPDGANAQGAGVFADMTGALTILDSDISNNTASAPGAGNGNGLGGGLMSFGPVIVERTLIADNKAFSNDAGASNERGGGVYLQANLGEGESRFVNSTITGNEAGNSAASGQGAGLFNNGPETTRLTHSTFFNNVASDPAAGDHVQNDGTGVIYTASLFTGGGAVNPCEGNPDSFASGGYNALSADDSCTADGTGDTTTPTGILSGGPAANGGAALGGSSNVSRRTIGIAAGAALDKVPPATCTLAGGTDARGLTRPQGAACDAGAFEACATPNGPAGFGCPPLVISDPPPQPPTNPPAKKCKKGQKRKKVKGKVKCVKKKRKGKK